MKILNICVVLLALVVSLTNGNELFDNSNPMTVISKSGIYRGIELNTSRAFLGIPFAKPPIGSLRFKPPVSPNFVINYNTSSYPLACYQTGITDSSKMSEDCLYLNVFTPMTNSNRGLFTSLPVMVFIHGGRYWTGYSAQFPGDLLAHLGDVVVVTIQYRLNIFGFQSFDDNTNNGLLDQQLALKWVRDNINFFGGNPNSVTIFGESAGGSSVLYHLTIPSSFSLYNRAIVQSAWQFLIPTAEQSRLKSTTVAAAKGCSNVTAQGQPDYTAILECLRALPAASILPTIGQSDFMVPMIDGRLILDLPLKSIRDQQWNSEAQVIIGHNYDEGNFMAYSRVGSYQPPTVPVSNTTYYNALNRYLTVYLNSTQASVIINAYEPIKAQLGNWYGAAEFFADYYIICGSILASSYMNQQNASLLNYIFNYSSPNYPADQWFLAASHGNELPYIFYQDIYTPYPFSVGDYLISDRMIRAWTDFAANGNPTSYVNDWPTQYPNAMYFGPDPTQFSDQVPYLKSICEVYLDIFE